MRVNWKKGLTRLFIIAGLAWAIFITWYLPVRNWHEYFEVAHDSWSACLSFAAEAQDKARLEQCNVEHDKALREIPHSAWAGYGWDGWLRLIGMAIVPPVVAYWLLRGVIWISNWIWRGFTKDVAVPPQKL